MQVTFYKIHDDVRCLEKDITTTKIGTLENITIKPTEAVSILSPELIMAYNDAYLNANYCYIDIFHRHYFCTVALAPGSRVIVSCKVDPLMSFQTGLKNIPVTVVRSQTAGINYVPDDSLPVNPSQFELYTNPLKENVFPATEAPAIAGPKFIVGINTAITQG